MYTLQQLIARGLLALEVIFFVGFYFYGSHGRRELSALQRDNVMLEGKVATLQKEIIHLNQEIDEWNTYPWYREKIARESLQMAFPGEEIFLLKHNKQQQELAGDSSV